MVKNSQIHLLNNPGVDTIELQPLPEDFQSIFVMMRKENRADGDARRHREHQDTSRLEMA